MTEDSSFTEHAWGSKKQSHGKSRHRALKSSAYPSMRNLSRDERAACLLHVLMWLLADRWDQLCVPSLCGEECPVEAASSNMVNPASFDGYHTALVLPAEGQPTTATQRRLSIRLTLVWNDPGCIMRQISRIIIRSQGGTEWVMGG